MPKPYIGRFAPTPSGGLHLGSLVAALASYLDAKAANGQWLIRIEDIDPPREVAGATDNILRTLEAYGFEWDGEILYQSNRLATYQSVIDRLLSNGLAYACTCSRKQLEDYSIYPNFCRDALKPCIDAAIRIRVPELIYQFNDRVQGKFSQHLGREVGDFIVKRRDGFFAYQLAVVLDDAEQGITDIVRGADLLDSTPRQLYLQELLGFSKPNYLHVPILLDENGHKLSKTQCSPILPIKQASQLLITALEILGQPIETNFYQETPKNILNYAVSNWCVDFIPKQQKITVSV
ncbi:tRNA glutamyl-Q(34) synthetase GluQRS [Entomomonas asaccharolytica]|uniref:Glutamyl-Q tRNA(Asp) synthetase n=1 Tax=Entomomonas asaccharolytica TaxID=2785331 RepID=A0A974NEI2_9GAMM|nr:tRNA glutamyl-Q(34) synthetase GluQRS [Entomomonas asaccharolytica]QQP84932.1 tRNA glutamyl-Q(34) synthetase GluQRS [Entomomonas asaccharolytica]